jgi:hypothetical protein
VPTNADISEFDVLFDGGFDEEASPLGAKGLGELTAVSAAPANRQRGLPRNPQAGARSADRDGEAVVNDCGVINPVFGCRIH